MSALARYFHQRGVRVSGYDRVASPITRSLEDLGISIAYEEGVELIPKEIDLVVYTPAIPKQHPAWKHFEENQIPVQKRSEVLATIAAEHATTYAVAGTHGKTTTSAILSHLLHEVNGDVTAFVGGIMTNYHTNYLFDPSGEVLVAEADEYDRSFLFLHPHGAVVTSTDADHLDIYETHQALLDAFQQFTTQVNRVVATHVSVTLTSASSAWQVTYAVDESADYQAHTVSLADGYQHFQLQTPHGNTEGWKVALPGKHNLENVTGALALLLEEGYEVHSLQQALASFTGVKRRFETVYQGSETVFVDDYAHHPDELRAAIRAARSFFPGKQLTGIFQPHLFSRTHDFEDGFARELAQLDELVLLDIYPARELPIPGVTSENLLGRVPLENKRLLEKEAVVPHLAEHRPEILLTLGAGDIDRLVAPIKRALEEWEA